MRNNTFLFFSGTEKHSVEVAESSTLLELMSVVEEKTGVPVEGQKLILSGKSLTSLDREKLLQDLRFKDGSKVMVLGKKFDPQSDEMFRQVEEVREKSFALAKRFAEVRKFGTKFAVLIIFIGIIEQP